MPATHDTTTTTPRTYLSRRTSPTFGVLYTVIANGMPTMADTTDRPAAVAEAMRVCGVGFAVWDGDRGEFLPPGPCGDSFDGDPGPYGDPDNRHYMRLEWFAGWACFVHEQTSWTEPAAVLNYFPVCRMSRADFRERRLGECEVRREYHGSYTGVLGDFRFPFSLAENVQSCHVERREIPRPKVGKATELRWNCGRWEKRTKTKGWHPAA